MGTTEDRPGTQAPRLGPGSRWPSPGLKLPAKPPKKGAERGAGRVRLGSQHQAPPASCCVTLATRTTCRSCRSLRCRGMEGHPRPRHLKGLTHPRCPERGRAGALVGSARAPAALPTQAGPLGHLRGWPGPASPPDLPVSLPEIVRRPGHPGRARVRTHGRPACAAAFVRAHPAGGQRSARVRLLRGRGSRAGTAGRRQGSCRRRSVLQPVRPPARCSFPRGWRPLKATCLILLAIGKVRFSTAWIDRVEASHQSGRRRSTWRGAWVHPRPGADPRRPASSYL